MATYILLLVFLNGQLRGFEVLGRIGRLPLLTLKGRRGEESLGFRV